MGAMNCPHCKTNLLRESRGGDAMIRTTGLVLKAASLVAICPKCKGDVQFSQSLTKAIQSRTVLFFKKS